MKILKGIALASVALLLAGAIAPAHAACGAAGILGTTDISGTTSKIWNPATFSAQYYGSYVFDYTPPLTPGFTGAFWAMGSGNPTSGAGDDNNGYFGDGAGNGAITFYGPGYYGSYFAADMFTAWAAAAQIDGCITNNMSRCTCFMLTDTANGASQFALLGRQADASSNTYFIQSGNDGAGHAGPILLADIPAPHVMSSVRTMTGGVDMTVTTPAMGVGDPGVYVDSPCEACITGAQVRILAIQQATGSMPPMDRDVAAWDVLASGPAGGSIAVSSPCDAFSSVDLYLATQIVFDPASGGGFGTTVVSSNSTRVTCGVNPTLADPVDVQRPRVKPGQPIAPKGEGRGR